MVVVRCSSFVFGWVVTVWRRRQQRLVVIQSSNQRDKQIPASYTFILYRYRFICVCVCVNCVCTCVLYTIKIEKNNNFIRLCDKNRARGHPQVLIFILLSNLFFLKFIVAYFHHNFCVSLAGSLFFFCYFP